MFGPLATPQKAHFSISTQFGSLKSFQLNSSVVDSELLNWF